MTTFRWYLLGLALLFGAYVAVEYYRPKPLDWTPTFQNKDKIPYGTYVLFDVLPEVMGVEKRDVKSVRVPIYNQIEGEDAEDQPDATTDDQNEAVVDESQLLESPTDSTETAEPRATTSSSDSVETGDADYMAGLAESGFPKATYLFVDDAFELSGSDCRSLLRHVARGNDVFIAAEQFDAQFADTLGFRTAPFISRPRLKGKPTAKLLQDSVLLQLSNPKLAGQAGRRGFRLPATGAAYRFLPDSGLRATQLATDTAGRAVLVRVPHGRGHLYLCTVPLAFTNYFVLQPRTSNFAFAALSYLPTARQVWWDEYQKQGRQQEQSLLRVVLAHDALRWALYLSMLGALLFVAFEARRRQRIIPVLKPLPNTTLLFTRTVASLYQQSGNHLPIMEKKIGLFLEHLRTRFHEPGLDLNDDSARERLAQKTGLPKADVDALVRRINYLLTAPRVSDAELLSLNKALNQFRKAAS
ncbi:DUF4350 domain-containing protein [Hymenobacter psychrotolerans]|uniref:DUF4350 domain-containing protein n=1 Tax=Hymenobacter psychrotolerans DSM 18569 TaxID=1121959 RepID=A0A1M6WJ67_9BACT|nr:DUF4350 domain-containing protein [Hymenobacter psychrotolerans]SHK93664.1 hypothetical protein SAMN02746009_01808 [Hymenobacter psychrotolerans DSM 18569]